MTVSTHPSGTTRLRENILALSILQALNYLVPLVTVPYLVRVLGPAHFGLLAFAQALVVYFDLLTNYGFNLSATRAVARRREEPADLAAIFWRTIYAKAALMLASAAVLTLVVAATPRLRETPWLFAGAFLTVAGSVTFPVWFFQGIERMKLITIAQASARLLSVPALLLLVRAPEHYVRAATIQGAVPILASLILLPVMRKIVPRPARWPRLREIKATLKEGWPVFVSHASLVINTATTTVVLGLVAGNTQVGYYSAAEKVIRAVTSLLGPVAQALYPHLNHLKAQSLDLALQMMRKSFAWIGVLALAASMCALVLANPVVRILWGPAFVPSVAVLRCLSPLPVFYALINILGIQTMLVFEMDEALTRIVLRGAVVNVFLSIALCAVFGAVGSAAAAVSTAALITAWLTRSVRHERFAPWRLSSKAA